MMAEQWSCLTPDRPSGWDVHEFAAFVDGHTWTFARTMPLNPHEYTLRRNCESATFDAAVRFIREHGLNEFFRGKPYTTLYFGAHKYWTMGSPLPETILINRKMVSADLD